MRHLPDLSRPGTKILIQRADRLGDMILALPVVEQLKQWFPQLQIDVLCSPISSALLKSHPHITQVHVAKLSDAGRIVDRKRLVADLTDQSYDVYLSLWDHPAFAWLGRACKIPARIGDSSNIINRWAYTHTTKQSWSNITCHQTTLNLELLAVFNQPYDPPETCLYPVEHWEKVVDALFHKYVDPTKKTVLIFCGTGGSNLGIPTQPLIELIQSLSDYTVIICYGTVDPNDPITHVDYPHVMNLTRLVPFEELISLIKRADFYIGPDTGPTHMASFLNKPMMVFSPKKSLFPSKWGPVSSCFRLVRTDYQCTDLCTTLCASPPSCTGLSYDRLFSTFQELVTDVYTQTYLDPAQKEQRRLKSTVRIAAIYTSLSARDDAASAIQHCQENGLKVYPFIWTGWGDFRRLLHVIRRYNITVMSGRLPLGAESLIRLYIGLIKQYVSPVFVSETIHQYISPEDYLHLYKMAWEERR